MDSIYSTECSPALSPDLWIDCNRTILSSIALVRVQRPLSDGRGSLPRLAHYLDQADYPFARGEPEDVGGEGRMVGFW